MSSNSNNKLDCTKGFLYKIQSTSGKTKGYLFGTIHQLPSESIHNLHPKIADALRKCSTLFVEINPLNPHLLATEIKKDPFTSHLSGEKIHQMVERVRAAVFDQPEAVEHGLIKRATELKMDIRDLETVESRRQASLSVKADWASLEVKKLYIAGKGLEMTSQKFQAIADQDGIDPSQKLLDAYDQLIETIKRIDFKLDMDEFTETRVGIIRTLDHVMAYCGLLCETIYGEKGKKMMALARTLYAEIKALDRGSSSACVRYLQSNQEKYITGDQKIQFITPLKRTLIEQEEINLMHKQTSHRDTFMLNSIQKSLEGAKEQERSFYAVGAAHLQENYHNLRLRLEEMGWKIVDAYANEKGA